MEMLQLLTKMSKNLTLLYFDIELCMKLNENDEKIKKIDQLTIFIAFSPKKHKFLLISETSQV